MPTGREVVDTIKEAFELFLEMELPLKEREVTIMHEAALPLIGYIERLEAAQPKWISVDNPPKEGGEYIVAAVTPDGKIVKTWDIFTTGSGWCSDKNVFEKVLYYMGFESLPEPPKEVTND